MVNYYLPKIKELHIFNYDMYKCPVDVLFSDKLNLIFGTNGLGKTTFLNIMQYSIIGPYIGGMESRNWKEQQKLKRPMQEKNYFRNRMSNQFKEAEVQVIYTLGQDIYNVTHSLYEHRLKKICINGQELNGENINYDTYEKKYFGQNDDNLEKYLIDKYHKNIVKSSNFPDINSFILMITEMMFFTESRDLVFWKQDLCKSILSKLMSKEKYFEYDDVLKLIKKYDSQARLMSYKMSMIKDFLGEDFLKKTGENTTYTLSDLQEINNKIENAKERISNIQNFINSNEREKKQNRIQNERICKKLLDVEKEWYENIFPDEYQKMYNRYVPSIINGKCPFCGERHLEKTVFVDQCFYCEKKINIKEDVNLNALEIEQKNLDNEKKRLQNNYDLLKGESVDLQKELREEDGDLQKLIELQQKIKRELDICNDDNVAKYRKLELQKQEYLRQLEQTKEREKKLASEIDECVYGMFLDYRSSFKKYAYSFLGNDKQIEFELVGKGDETFFKFYLNGTERESELSLSESQRIFVDMAYRLATLEFFHKDAYFISETPDSTLDYIFESNAVKTFSYFIDSGNALFMSANARNSQLISSLVNQYRNDYKLVNLLKISNLAGAQLDELRKLEIYNFLEDES